MALTANGYGTVTVFVVSVNDAAQTCSVRVTDNNGQPITAAATVPTGVVTPTAPPVSVGDVLENNVDGRKAVVSWIDPANPTRWSPAASGTPALSTEGWHEVGTFTPL